MTKRQTGGGGSTRSGAAGRRNRRAVSSKAQPFPAKRMGTASTNPDRALPDSKKAGFYREKSKINLLNLYNSKPNLEKMRERPIEPVRIQPDRRWFGNTRVITQTKLEQFRDAMDNARKDPYSVVLKRSKLPVSLFNEDDQGKRAPRVDLLSIEPFGKTFGKKQLRKRAKLNYEDLSNLAVEVDKRQLEYHEPSDQSIVRDDVDPRDAVSEEVFKKGTSRRIWQELYKVVDSSDVIVQVIDARDPMGTRCQRLESHIRKDRPNKHVILLLNKCDLIPTWAAARWVKVLGSEYPTIAFHSSLTNPFGKMTLMNLLRQYASLLKERKHVSVGFIGYPNVGKSSVINTLRKKRVCKAAPVPGETKVWQYVALTHRLYLIDCPGVVPGDAEAGDETAKVLKGVVRAERIAMPEEHVGEVLARAKKEDLIKRYELPSDSQWSNADEFLTALARKKGRLLKGGEPDISTSARVVLYDWQRGRIPFFVSPPFRHSGDLEEALPSEEPEIAQL